MNKEQFKRKAEEDPNPIRGDPNIQDGLWKGEKRMNKEIDWQGIAKCWETLVKENQKYEKVLRKFYVAMRGAGVPEKVIESIFNKDTEPEVIYTKGLEYLKHEVVLKFFVKDYELENKK